MFSLVFPKELLLKTKTVTHVCCIFPWNESSVSLLKHINDFSLIDLRYTHNKLKMLFFYYFICSIHRYNHDPCISTVNKALLCQNTNLFSFKWNHCTPDSIPIFFTNCNLITLFVDITVTKYIYQIFVSWLRNTVKCIPLLPNPVRIAFKTLIKT